MPDQKNTVVTDNGLEIYTDDMYIYADEYIASLHDPDSVYSASGNTFTGMIKYINKHMRFTKDICADINILNNIWETYTDLVYKYNQRPTIEEYAILIGVNRDTIYSWMKGEYRSGDICEKLSLSRPDTVKKWSEECRLSRYKGAAAGNVGCIFLCKAVDGMVETAPLQIENPMQKTSKERILELQEHYGADNPLLEPPKADF